MKTNNLFLFVLLMVAVFFGSSCEQEDPVTIDPTLQVNSAAEALTSLGMINGRLYRMNSTSTNADTNSVMKPHSGGGGIRITAKNVDGVVFTQVQQDSIVGIDSMTVQVPRDSQQIIESTLMVLDTTGYYALDSLNTPIGTLLPVWPTASVSGPINGRVEYLGDGEMGTAFVYPGFTEVLGETTFPSTAPSIGVVTTENEVLVFDTTTVTYMVDSLVYDTTFVQTTVDQAIFLPNEFDGVIFAGEGLFEVARILAWGQTSQHFIQVQSPITGDEIRFYLDRDISAFVVDLEYASLSNPPIRRIEFGSEITSFADLAVRIYQWGGGNPVSANALPSLKTSFLVASYANYIYRGNVLGVTPASFNANGVVKNAARFNFAGVMIFDDQRIIAGSHEVVGAGPDGNGETFSEGYSRIRMWNTFELEVNMDGELTNFSSSGLIARIDFDAFSARPNPGLLGELMVSDPNWGALPLSNYGSSCQVVFGAGGPSCQ